MMKICDYDHSYHMQEARPRCLQGNAIFYSYCHDKNLHATPAAEFKEHIDSTLEAWAVGGFD